MTSDEVKLRLIEAAERITVACVTKGITVIAGNNVSPSRIFELVYFQIKNAFEKKLE